MATKIPVFDPNKSPVLIEARHNMLGRMAALRRRREVGAIISNDDIPTSPGLLEATTEPGVLSSETALDSDIVPSGLVAKFEAMGTGFPKTIPGLFDTTMTVKRREEVISDIQTQETNWGKLPPAEITVPKEEVMFWSSFINTAKDNDFANQKSIESLERGEILDLTIGGFKQFQILKIRAKDKEGRAMCVVDLIVDTPEGRLKGKVGAHYFIALPLVEGGKLTLINKKTMTVLNSYKIEKMSINPKHHFSIKPFLDMLIRK